MNRRQRTGCLKLAVVLLINAGKLDGQSSEINRLVGAELQMNFPSIYFQHNSTDYAAMPYTADSCLKYIAAHEKDIKSFVLWRDSSETEQLSYKRIKKLKSGLSLYTAARRINILSMDKKQKISGHTIQLAGSTEQKNYLLSLNSVLDISTARLPLKKDWKICWHCLLRLKPCQRNTFLFSRIF